MVTPPHRRVPRAELADYLLSTMGWAATGWRRDDSLTTGLATYRRAVGKGLSHLPLFLVHDLRMLAEHGNTVEFTEDVPAHIDAAVREAYTNRVLNRLLRESCVQQALEVLGSTRGRAHGDRALRLALILVDRLAEHWPKSTSVDAAHLRDLSLDPREAEEVDVGPVNSGLREAVEQFVESATGARPGADPVEWSKLIEAGDLFELEHLEVLDRDYLRAQVRNLILVRDSITPLAPHQLTVPEEEAEVETLFADDSPYPSGGLSEITTAGSFENLVLSELMYMGESVGHGVDLFDLRYADRELLYYTRDSGQLLRKRRTLNFIEDLRSPLGYRDPSHQFQLGTMMSGLILATIRDLATVFRDDSLRYRLILLTSEHGMGVAEADKVRDVFEILFRTYIHRGQLAVEVVTELDLNTLASGTRKSVALVFSPDVEALSGWVSTLDELRGQMPPLFGVAVNLAEHEVHLGDGGGATLHLDLGSSPLAALEHDLLRAVLDA